MNQLFLDANYLPEPHQFPAENSPEVMFGSLTGGDIGIGTSGPFEYAGARGIDVFPGQAVLNIDAIMQPLSVDGRGVIAG